jgi:hypothetical protein
MSESFSPRNVRKKNANAVRTPTLVTNARETEAADVAATNPSATSGDAMSDRHMIRMSERAAVKEPITRQELDRLNRRLREPPVPGWHCTPDGASVEIVNRLQRERDAIRASFLSKRLQICERHAQNAFGRARVRGTATRDFELSR